MVYTCPTKLNLSEISKDHRQNLDLIDGENAPIIRQRRGQLFEFPKFEENDQRICDQSIESCESLSTYSSTSSLISVDEALESETDCDSN